jgi:hypothetical protein
MLGERIFGGKGLMSRVGSRGESVRSAADEGHRSA